MRILIHCANYAPEWIGIGKFTAEMAEWLAARGHRVRVVTAPPYYPEWKIHTGYPAWRYSRETRAEVEIWRCPLWVPRQPSGIKRTLHLLSFTLASLPVMICQAAWRADIVFTVEPPFFCAPHTWLASCLGRSVSWLHIQDFEVDAAFALGLLTGRRLRQAVNWLEQKMLRRFNRVSTISTGMLARLAAKGIVPAKTSLFANWVDLEEIRPDPEAGARLRRQLGIPTQAIIALYAGNMGDKQGLEILLEAARILSNQPHLHFLLCGTGAGRKALEERAQALPNVRFLPLQPPAQLNALLNLADIHMLPQKPGVSDLVMPSKLAGMAASGRPIVTNAADGSQLARLVSQCGLVIPPQDAQAFALALARLAGNADERSRLGTQSRALAANIWDKQKILRELERAMLSLCRLEGS